MNFTTTLLALAVCLPAASAQPSTAPLEETPSTTSSSIAWYGTWESGAAEAKRTGLPILLMSAAPRCHDIPGLW